MMAMSAGDHGGSFEHGAWSWWEGRRLGYNIALGLSGWVAYGLTLALYHAFHRFYFTSFEFALSVTLLLGCGFLVVMGAANIFYLLGALTESIVAPADRAAFRRQAFALGFWGSVAAPFIFPLINFSLLIGL